MKHTMETLVEKGVKPSDIAKILKMKRDEVIKKITSSEELSKYTATRKKSLKAIHETSRCSEREATMIFEALYKIIKEAV
jgi:hypothetical protein